MGGRRGEEGEMMGFASTGQSLALQWAESKGPDGTDLRDSPRIGPLISWTEKLDACDATATQCQCSVLPAP